MSWRLGTESLTFHIFHVLNHGAESLTS